MKLDLLYEDDHLFVVNKPSGMLVHRGWGRDPLALVDLVREHTRDRRAHPIQRLDRGASGVIVFARYPEMARQLAAAQISKRYLAIVRGVAPEALVIDYPLQRRPDGPQVPAVSEVRRLSTAPSIPRQVSLVEVRPQTGRPHQIRRHLAHIHCPILGDSRYGRSDLNRAFAANYGLSRLALHAAAWQMEHPITGQSIGGMARLPADLLSPLLSIGLQVPAEFAEG